MSVCFPHLSDAVFLTPGEPLFYGVKTRIAAVLFSVQCDFLYQFFQGFYREMPDALILAGEKFCVPVLPEIILLLRKTLKKNRQQCHRTVRFRSVGCAFFVRTGAGILFFAAGLRSFFFHFSKDAEQCLLYVVLFFPFPEFAAEAVD